MIQHITPSEKMLGTSLRLVTRAHFMRGVVEIAAFAGATSMTADQIEQKHAEVLARLRERVEGWPGSYVLYDMCDDGDGWLLVGDDPQALHATTEEHLATWETLA